MSDTLPLPENRRAIPWHWIVLGLLVVVHAGLGAWLNPMGLEENASNSFVVHMIVGFLFSQPVLFALWATFAPQRFYHRFPLALLLCGLVSFILEIVTLFSGEGRRNGFFMIFYLGAFLVATLLMLLVRRLSRWQFTQSTKENLPSTYQANQFGIKHLLILTTITALICGLFRTLTEFSNPHFSFAPIAEIARCIFLLIVLFAPITFIPRLTLAYHKNMLLSVFRAIILFGGIDSAAYYLFGHPSNAEIIQPILFAQLGAALSVLFTTLVMRWCGFRMVRMRKTAS